MESERIEKEYVELVKRKLIKANSDVAEALSELDYAVRNDWLERNSEGILEMIGEAKTELEEIFEDLEVEEDE